MRISDWSSDVCSSDLLKPPRTVRAARQILDADARCRADGDWHPELVGTSCESHFRATAGKGRNPCRREDKGRGKARPENLDRGVTSAKPPGLRPNAPPATKLPPFLAKRPKRSR